MILKLALKHLISKPFLSIFTLVAVAASLSILGVFWTVVENLERVKVSQVKSIEGETLPGLTVFLDSHLSNTDVENIRQKLIATGSFANAQVISSSEALKTLESQFGETLSKAFASESLPITLKLDFASNTLKREEFMTLLNSVRSMPGVLDVDDGMSVVPTEQGARAPGSSISKRVFSWANGLLILVFAIVAMLVSHLIRIAFESRKPEVETLKVLGASKFWIFQPLLLEGLFFGAAGALTSLGILALCVNVVFPKFASVLLPKGLELASLSGSSTLCLLALGVGASIVGALFTWPLIETPAREV
jgi:cell division transport system permease protein